MSTRALGVDVGTVRVGLAVSDPGGLVATPLGTLEVGDDASPGGIARRVLQVAAEHACGTIVVGLPKALSGRDTAATAHARDVADRLRGGGTAVELWDERLSSVEAERTLLSAGRRRGQRRKVRDQVAATIILQGWLDTRRR